MDILERFIKYVKIGTPSSSYGRKIPSTACQRVLASVLVEELKALGLEVYYDEKLCYVYGVLKGNEEAPSLGFITHLDTSEDAKGEDIKPNIIEKYNGDAIYLADGLVIDANNNPDLKNHLGKTLITSDGTTLLGADDKAGIAEVMTMLEYFAQSSERHGDIWVSFVPDEEIGTDMDYFDTDIFKADYAYTVDGVDLGEITYENFNAASVKIKIKGTVTHLGYAKGILVNSLKVAQELYSLLPNEDPSNTEGYEGYFHLREMKGNEAFTEMDFIIRDFDKKGFLERKRTFQEIVTKLNEVYGDIIELEISDSYYNMREKIQENKHLIDKACKAMEKRNIKPIKRPIRGGTSGARLSFMGIACPNLGTGGHNFHSYSEYIALEDMEEVAEILIQIVKEYAKDKDILKLQKKR